MEITTRQIATTLRALSVQFATPWYLNPEVVRHIEGLGYAKFNEWPSGHWEITDRGSAFLSELREVQ